MNALVAVFLTGLFLIKAPSFYFLPYFDKIVSSHSLAKIIFLFIFIYFVIYIYQKKNNLFKEIFKDKIFLLIIFFFAGQSASIIFAKDIVLFWKNYHNIMTGILIFLNVYILRKLNILSLRIINMFVLSVGGLLILIELIFFTASDLFLPLFNLIIQKEMMDAYLTNMFRGKSSLELNLEIFFPLYLSMLFLLNKNKIIKFLLITALILIAYLGALSNFRTRLVLLVFLFSASFIIFFYYHYRIVGKRKNKLKIFLLLFLLMSVGNYFGLKMSERLYSFNILDRFSLENAVRDIGSINYRIDAIKESFYQFRSSPLFGVGLGNFSYYDKKEIFVYDISKPFLRSYYDVSHQSPHNIFFQTLGETGLIGFISFTSLLVYLLFQDFIYIRGKKNILLNGYIVSSWGFVVYSLFNPSSSIFVLGWFWFFRGLIASYYKK